MKMMIAWELHPEKRSEIISGFSKMDLADYQAQQGDTIEVLGRWHDIVNGRGVAICETDDSEALSRWLLKWNAGVDFEIAVVHDDEEAHAIIRSEYG